MRRIKLLLQNPYFITGLVILIIIVVSAQSLLLGLKTFTPDGIKYTHYNNYVIFKQSFFHLMHNKDLYVLYPEQHWDLYKYSPAFALLMAPFALLPDFIGLTLWNLLNGLVLVWALLKLPVSPKKKNIYFVAFVLIELISSLQNTQSNALIAGLIIFAFLFLEKKNIAMAALCIVLTFYIKLFGIVALSIFIFYPGKLKAALYTLGWAALFAALPLIVVSFTQLTFLYKSWLSLLQNDHDASLGYSVMGWLQSWFNININKNFIVLAGAALFCVPLLKFRFYKNVIFKLFFLSSILLWVVIFNHKAESPTFVIAVTGVAIWYFSQAKNLLNTILVIMVFVLTVLSPTDIFPAEIRSTYVHPYALKAVPCILVWLKLMFDMIFFKSSLHRSFLLPSS